MDGNNLNNQSKPGKGFGITALVLGIVSLITSLTLCCGSIFSMAIGFIAGVTGIVFGIIAIAKKSGRGMGIAGLICSIASAIIAVIVLILSFFTGMGLGVLDIMLREAAEDSYYEYLEDYEYDYDYDYDYDWDY